MTNISSRHLLSRTGKLLVISCFSMSLVGLPLQTLSNAQTSAECEYYNNCYPPDRFSRYCSGRNSRATLVEFVARGDDWANVWLNQQNVFQPRNYNRRQVLSLCPGAYRIVFTGNTRFDVWSAGYLDVGRTNIVRIAFSKNGLVEVQGDPSAWLPDESIDLNEVWRR